MFYSTDEAGVSQLRVDWNDLPNPEDLAAKDELQFVGFYILLSQEYSRVSKLINNNPSAAPIWYEGLIEKWLDRARDFAPEWFQVDRWYIKQATDSAIQDVVANANEHAHKKPNIRTLSEEYAEAILAERGKHEHPLRLELVQIAGICVNMIRQIDAGEEFKK